MRHTIGHLGTSPLAVVNQRNRPLPDSRDAFFSFFDESIKPSRASLCDLSYTAHRKEAPRWQWYET